MTLWRSALCFLAGLPAASGARHASLRATLASKAAGSTDAARAVSGGGTGTEAAMSTMVQSWLEGKGPHLQDIVASGEGKMSMEDAMHQLDGQLPAEVASLVRMSSNATSQPAQFTEASLTKARKILNNMVYDAVLELDDIVFECKEFEERNRGTYEQVINDLGRLGSQLAIIGQTRLSASSGIAEYDRKRKLVEQQIRDATAEFNEERFKNEQILTVRQNDLAVFDYVLTLTKCTPGQVFLQTDENETSRPAVSICSANDGMYLDFEDKALQAKVERMMTPNARAALREALGQVAGSLNLVQLGANPAPPTPAPPTPAPLIQPVVYEVSPVQEEPHPEGQWRKCVSGTPNCGLLHDLMSLEWGRFRDDFDEHTALMQKNKEAYDIQMKNFNNLLTDINDAKTKFMGQLAEAIANINADTEEMNEKDEQKFELTHEYDREMARCHFKISEILFTRICAVRKVRNILWKSWPTPPIPEIIDCDVTDWVSQRGECYSPGGQAILCDDSCPRKDPNKCGGKEWMTRYIVTVPNSIGIKCPPLNRKKRCAQKKCPVDCLMSEWSGWSKCSKECGSGMQVRDRYIIRKPANGGVGCDAVDDERPCNTHSCDRDCKLYDWSDWSPCSEACDGGRKTRRKKVLVPTRGQGWCPKKNNWRRRREEDCNQQECNGDEICIAQQDLIIALDSSGSLRASGWTTLQKFAVELTRKYTAQYFGLEAVKLGANLFGNGHLVTQADGTTTISAAKKVQDLTFTFAEVRTKLQAETWARGFTNMAQALALADTMLSEGGREAAQSAVLVISDGKYSMKYQTQEKVRELKDKNIQIFMAVVGPLDRDAKKVLRGWASKPASTNFLHVEGLAELEHNTELFVQKFVVKFCPDALSKTALEQEDGSKQYMMIHENGLPSNACGAWTFEGVVSNHDECATLARARTRMAFGFGREYARGRCYSEAIVIDKAWWNQYYINRANPPCPNGAWEFNPFYDTYAIDPDSIQATTTTTTTVASGGTR